jgi:centromeric protein E
LKYEHLQTIEEHRDLVNENQKLSEEAAYAKELASSAAVELKNLAEEVTKLSVENAKQAKELLVAREMAHSRVNGRKGRITSRGRDEVGTWSLDLEDMKMELQARRQREASLEAALAEKEHLEEEYKRKFDEAKKKELSLENDLAGMWVLVAKSKRGASGISDLNVDDRSVNLADITNGTKENKGDKNFALVEKQVSDDTMKSLTAEEQTSPEFEPLLVRLKVYTFFGWCYSSIWKFCIPVTLEQLQLISHFRPPTLSCRSSIQISTPIHPCTPIDHLNLP